MIPSRYRNVFSLSATLLVGCSSVNHTPTQTTEAMQRWNDTRTSALYTLASDQFKEGSLEKSQETLGQALHIEPNNVALHLLAAKLAVEQDQLEAADAQISEVHRLDPSNAEADYLKGVLLERWHDPTHAQAAYADAVNKNPKELAYLLADAEMLVLLDKSPAALTLLQSKLSVFEHSGVMRDEIGLLFANNKQYDESIVMLQEASRLSENDQTIREHLAFTLYAASRFTEAQQVFDRLAKEKEYSQRADILAALGECQAQGHLYTDAQQSFDSATKLNPSCSGYWMGFAKVMVQSDDLPRADVAIRRAVSLDASSSEAHQLLGVIRLKQNQLPQALAAFQAASDLNPQNSMNVSLQGYTLARMGRTAEAQTCYRRARQINPDDTLANRLGESVN
jgi:Flp pilus assembly protein TadD